jgi:hypothetical protein
MRKCENLVFYKESDNKLGMTEEQMSGAKPRGDFSLKKCQLCNKLYTED